MKEKPTITVAKASTDRIAGRAIGRRLKGAILLALAISFAHAAQAAEEPVLKPDVPKFDATDGPDRSTLKGTIEHRLSAPLPPRKQKKLNANANAA
ncbi:MAG: hypothetical protein WCT03_17610, partial [Candidatus Obscuribacterales bacterium]